MDKSTQEKIEANCSAEFIESLKILGEHVLTDAILFGGYSVGYEDGCLETKHKLARKMLKQGLSMKTVKKCTGLSEEEIVALLIELEATPFTPHLTYTRCQDSSSLA